MKEMIKAMVQEMVMQSIKEVMGEMLGAPSVAPAEVEKPIKQSYTMEELLTLEEDKEVIKHNASLQPLTFICEDFKPEKAKNYRKGLKYNKYISNRAVWTYNHLMIREKYPNIKYSNQHYYADSLAELHSFWNMCSLVENLTEEQFAVVKKYWDSKKK